MPNVLIALALFVAAVVVVLFAGPRMARTADALAEATGLGGALFGVVFLALATDLPEIALTPAAVLGGTPRIAVGGLLGGAAAQLLLIAVVDMSVRTGSLAGRVSLRTSVGQCALMVAVLGVPLLLTAGAPTWGGLGVGTIVLPVTYIGLLAAIRGIDVDDAAPSPSAVDDVIADDGRDRTGASHPSAHDPLRSLWSRFVVCAVLLAAAGVALESATETIGSTIGLGETAAGALVAGSVAPLPELVTAVSAARAGALELAVGDLVGSSALDVALLAMADVFYTEGSIFEMLGRPEFTLIGMSTALTALLLVGLARRQPVSAGRIGMESYLMVGVYVGGAAMLVASGG